MSNKVTQNLKKIYQFLAFYSITYIAKTGITSFFPSIFGGSTHGRTTLSTYLESWGYSVPENVLFMQDVDLNFDLIWPELDLTSVKSQAWWHYSIEWPSLPISTCKMTQKTRVARHACDFNHDLRTRAALLLDIV